MITAYNSFEKIVEQCFDFDSKRFDNDRDFRIKTEIKNIWEFLIKNKPGLIKTLNIKGNESVSLMKEYLTVHSLSFEGHARLREMVLCMSEYMDYCTKPKGEKFNKIYKEFVEMVKPDGRSNAENYFKEHSHNNDR